MSITGEGADALILELKIDSRSEEAIQQIKDKNYALRSVGKIGERPKYTGRILAVGMSAMTERRRSIFVRLRCWNCTGDEVESVWESRENV